MTEFRPLPLLGNPHVQTVLGTYLSGPELPVSTRSQPVLLHDGDRLLLHDNMPPAWQPGDWITVLAHGMGGSHRSGYMLRMAHRLLRHRVRVVRIDLRGGGHGAALARRIYNAAASEDVRMALEEVHRWSPTSPLVLVGYSLGGNMVLKLAGEAAAEPVEGLAAVAAVAAPIDLERCAQLLALPRNRLYDMHFARCLVRLVRRQQRHFPELATIRFPRRMTTRLFDELYTAPRGGFADALDYYRRAASYALIPRIQVPALLLTARDDPFIAVEPFETLATPAHVEVQILARGGHLGFLGWDGAGGIRWAERRVTDWIIARRANR